MKTVPVTPGLLAFVDDEDWPMVSHFRWHRHSGGYATTGDGHTYMHRMLLLPEPEQCIDHVNRNKLDNRRSNLRLCTVSENVAAGVFPPGLHSRYRGVTWERGWLAQIKVNQRRLGLGRYKDEVKAALAYDLKALAVFGPFARTNFLRYEQP